MKLIKWLLGAGVVLRGVQFLWDRSAWGDEASLVLNIAKTPYWGLLKPFQDGSPGAPFGFQFIEKWMISQFGMSEYALRFFPLIAGIAALWLFYVLIQRVATHPAVVPVGLALFVFSDNLIYYSAEMRPGSMDVLTAIVIALLVVKPSFSTVKPILRVGVVGLVGGSTLWFSHSALFCLACAGAVELIDAIRHRNEKKLRVWMGISALWALSFGLNYGVSLRYFMDYKGIHSAFATAFMPFPPKTGLDALWLPMSLLRQVAYFAGLRLTLLNIQMQDIITLSSAELLRFIALNGPLLGAILVIVGVYTVMVWRGGMHWVRSNKNALVILGGPFLLAVMASCGGHYPFVGRFLLFTFPFLTCITAEAVVQVSRGPRHWGVKGAVIGLVFGLPVGAAVYHLARPRALETIKFGMVYLMTHAAPSDIVLLTTDIECTGEFYRKKFSYHQARHVHPEDLQATLERFKGARIWVLCTKSGIVTGIPVFQNADTRVYQIAR